MTDVTTPTGIAGMITSGMGGIDEMQGNLEAQMAAAMDPDTEISNAQLIALQYELGKFQTYITTLNNTVNSLQNQSKELAKSIN